MTGAAPAKFRFDLDLGHRQERNSVMTESAIAALVDQRPRRGSPRGSGRRRAHRHGQGRAGDRQAAQRPRRPHRGHERRARRQSPRDARATPCRSPPPSAASSRATCSTREPTAEIEALIAECLASLDAVPHLVIRCNARTRRRRARDRHRPASRPPASPAASSSSAIPTSAMGDARHRMGRRRHRPRHARARGRDRRAHRPIPRRPGRQPTTPEDPAQ